MNAIEQYEVRGGHREIGRGIGHQFADAIQRFFDNYEFLQKQLLPFLNNPAGQRLHRFYLELRRIHFPQITPSSERRLARARSVCRNMPPDDADRVLALLGDRTDHDHPIHCDATPPDISATLCSALFDLDNRRLRIYRDNPLRKPEKCIRITM